MKKEFIISEDGSTTIFLPELNEHYHSHFGALQEARHIFIERGIGAVKAKDCIRILEVGFGTGLNAFLTAVYSFESDQKVDYVGVEPFPLSEEETNKLNFVELVGTKYAKIFKNICSHEPIKMDGFNLSKRFITVENYLSGNEMVDLFDVVYFDAFGPDVQPDLWNVGVFKGLFKLLKVNGFLITYSCKGSVKRALKEAGFDVTKLPGPKGKREITKATRLSFNNIN